MGTWFSDKYAEGTVGHRFYAGCQNVDTVEALAAEHARELFGARVRLCAAALRHRRQPGRVLVDPGPPRRVAGAGEARAPRTSTSSPRRTGSRCATSSATSGCSACPWTPAATSPTASARTSAARCSTSAPTAPTRRPGCSTTTGSRAAAREFKPLVLIAGYSAYPRRVNFAKMREIADEVGATLMVDMAHFAGPGRRQGVHRRREPGALRPRHHHDHAQVAARPARRPGAGHRGVRRRRSTAAARWCSAARSRT